MARHAGMAASVLDTFERLAADGQPMEPGVRIRFGWSLLRLVDDGGALRVAEPDFALWPEERWMLTIDETLGVLGRQIALLHRLDVEGEDAFFDQFIVTAPGALREENVFLRRTASVGPADSGWLLGSTDDPEALAREHGLERILVASLVAGRSSLLQALTLPRDFIAVFSGESLEQVFDSSGAPRELPDMFHVRDR